MFKHGDIVTLVSGRVGVFVRYYGAKVQIRTADDMKVTGTPIEEITGPESEESQSDPGELFPEPAVKERALVRLGKVQIRMLEAMAEQPQISYRELARACGITIPQAAITVKGLVRRGEIIKTQVDGHNRYDKPVR